MFKKIITILAIFAITIGLFGCADEKEDNPIIFGTITSEINDNPITLDNGIANNQAPAYPLQTFTYTSTDTQGYQTKYTLSIGAWLKSTDTEQVKKAWSSVGGKSDLPPIFGGGSSSMGRFEFKTDETVCAVGWFQIENVTPDWSRNDWSVLNVPLGSNVNIYNTSMYLVKGTEFSDSSTATFLNDIKGVKMSGNASGRIPFSIGALSVFSPNNPDGRPELDDVEFTWGDVGFRLQKSWGDNSIEPLSLMSTSMSNTYVPYSGGYAISTKKGYISDNGYWYGDGGYYFTGYSGGRSEFDTTQDVQDCLISVSSTGYGGYTFDKGVSGNVSFSGINLYDTLSGTLAVSAQSYVCSGNTIIKIYADDKLIYTSPSIKYNTDPINFSVSIKGSSKLNIEYEDVGETGDAPSVAVYNAMLYPQGYDIPPSPKYEINQERVEVSRIRNMVWDYVPQFNRKYSKDDISYETLLDYIGVIKDKGFDFDDMLSAARIYLNYKEGKLDELSELGYHDITGSRLGNLEYQVAFKDTADGVHVIIAFNGTDFELPDISDPTNVNNTLMDLIANSKNNPINGEHEGYKTMAAVFADHEKNIKFHASDITTYTLFDLIKSPNTKFTIIGHSMGGAISQCYAIHLLESGVSKERITGYTFNSALAVTSEQKYYYTDLRWFNVMNRTDNVSSGAVWFSLGENGRMLGYNVPINDPQRPNQHYAINSNLANGEHSMRYLWDCAFDKM